MSAWTPPRGVSNDWVLFGRCGQHDSPAKRCVRCDARVVALRNLLKADGYAFVLHAEARLAEQLGLYAIRFDFKDGCAVAFGRPSPGDVVLP